MSEVGRTAKNSRKALTSELPPITDMVRPRRNGLRLPSAAKAAASSFWSDRFLFWEKIAMGRVAISLRRSRETFAMVGWWWLLIAHRGPRDVFSDGRWSGWLEARTRVD